MRANKTGVGVEVGVGTGVAVGVGLGTAVIVGVFVGGKVEEGLSVGVEVGAGINLGENTEQAVWKDSKTRIRRMCVRFGFFIVIKTCISDTHSISSLGGKLHNCSTSLFLLIITLH
jgi:hypothetical protein